MVQLSIIIPYYNAGAFVERALDAARAQMVYHAEIIVVNDGSNAKDTAIIKGLASKYDVLLNQENAGQASARNAGITIAKGRYILNWDADDWFEPDFCRKAIKIFESDTTVRLVTCHAYHTYGKKKKELIKPKGGLLEDFLFDNAAMGSSMFFKEDWLEVGGYDEAQILRGFEDWEFYIRLLKRGGRAQVIEEVLFNYFSHEGSTTLKIKDGKIEKRKYILLKHADLYKGHYPRLVEDLFYRLEIETREKIKNTRRLEFILGSMIINPIRKFKSLFR